MNELASKQDVMKEIYKYFKKDEKMALLAGDMGFAVLDDYFDNHKNRAFNIGICEQATISMSAGMFLAGLKPIVYSQVPFLVMRAYEQIRYDLNEHSMNVKLIGVGANNYFEKLGRSHCMDDDDIDMMKIFKNFLILSPTKDNLPKSIKEMFEYKGPVYVRCK
ncbi:transketolase [Arcobacter sp. CECT 8986]|uniref:transketolase n=1 Tax=Arcobacter sp. CECT 8986 TaxID=2044507 RepID=UPI001009BC9F|nr:transketolase [Arcobacter sp. CECT 8986]RXJ98211.1 transketolase [Arcobacter sp. CECT 8986]